MEYLQSFDIINSYSLLLATYYVSYVAVDPVYKDCSPCHAPFLPNHFGLILTICMII